MILYNNILNSQLQGVVKKALEHTLVYPSIIDEGHSFYITFRPTHRLAKVPSSIADLDEATIVLENEFWNLKIDDSGFHVDLMLGSVTESLYIPFASIIAFRDPHADFGLDFEVEVAINEFNHLDLDEGMKTLTSSKKPSASSSNSRARSSRQSSTQVSIEGSNQSSNRRAAQGKKHSESNKQACNNIISIDFHKKK